MFTSIILNASLCLTLHPIPCPLANTSAMQYRYLRLEMPNKHQKKSFAHLPIILRGPRRTQSIFVNNTKILFHNYTVLVGIPRHSVVFVGELPALHLPNKCFVMGDDDKLEVLLVLPVVDDLIQRTRECLDIIGVKISCWFVESDDLDLLIL